MLNVLILTHLCVQFISVKVTELPPVWERVAYLAYHQFVKICLSIFPFDVWDKLWILIRPVPVVSLLIYFDTRGCFEI